MRRLLTLLILLALLPGAASAYTIYLQDGAQIIAREEFKIEGDYAMIVLTNGTRTSLNMDEIDLERTRAANESRYGAAVILDDNTLTDVSAPPGPPDGPETLADLIASGKAGTRTRPSARRPPTAPQTTQPKSTPPQVVEAARKEHQDLILVGEIEQAFHAQGLPDVRVFHGARRDRPLVEIVTDSEAAVFRALETAAPLLLQLQESFPGESEELELALLTAHGEDAGRFVLDRRSATELIDHQVDISAFYVRRVIF